MFTRCTLAAAVVAAFSVVLAPAARAEPPTPRKTLTAFTSDQELAATLKRWADEAQRKRDDRARRMAGNQSMLAKEAAPASAPVAAFADKAEADAVTNVQHAGVDEGGIVKVHGDHLVVLRRGRLFTVRIGDNQ